MVVDVRWGCSRGFGAGGARDLRCSQRRCRLAGESAHPAVLWQSERGGRRISDCAAPDPRGPANWIILVGLTISHYFERDYSAAAEMAQRMIRDYPEFVSPYRWLAAALGQLDRTDAARDALRKAIEVSPEVVRILCSWPATVVPPQRPRTHARGPSQGGLAGLTPAILTPLAGQSSERVRIFRRPRHCERSEAISISLRTAMEIAASLRS